MRCDWPTPGSTAPPRFRPAPPKRSPGHPSDWIDNTLDTWKRLCDPVAEQISAVWASALPEEAKRMAGPLLGMISQMGGMAFGSQLGQALGKLSSEVLTSTDIGLPLGPKGVAALMPQAIEEFSAGLEQPRSEILTFLAAREAAHHRLFSHVPWLSSQLLNTVEAYARGIKIDMSGIEELAQGFNPAALADPAAMEQLLNQGMFEPKASPEQTAALERLETLLALIEGWVQTVVTAALGDRIPGAQALSETLRRRRASGGPAEQTFATLVGLELRPRKLREAATLWERLTDAAGVDGRDAVWQHPDLLPSAADLDEPAGFIDRSDRRRQQRYRPGDRRPGEVAGRRRTRRTRRTPETPPRLWIADPSRGSPACHSRRMTQQYSLDPAMPVLLRPDGAVQVGWDPRRAVLVRPPSGLTASALAHVLRMMRSNVAIDELHREATRFGPVDADEFAALIDLAGRRRSGPGRRVHGAAGGPRRSACTAAVRSPICCWTRCAAPGCGSATPRRHTPWSGATRPIWWCSPTTWSLTPDWCATCTTPASPHLLVRVRDGTGLVGPMVIPGQTSCLACADLHRSDRDAAWPALAAQLRDTVGVADHSTVLATAALALGQVQTVVQALDASLSGRRGLTQRRPPTLSGHPRDVRCRRPWNSIVGAASVAASGGGVPSTRAANVDSDRSQFSVGTARRCHG